MPEVSPLSVEKLLALVTRSQDGDSEAFGEIYDHFVTQVYRYIVFRFPEQLAEDLVADIFVKAWEKLHTYKVRAGVPFGAWLFRIARHTLIDAYRKTRGFEEIPEDMPDEAKGSDPSARTEQALTVSSVRQAIHKLPKDYQDVLLLHYVVGLKHEEIARSLQMTEGYVRILKFRGLKKLESLLPKSVS